MTLKYETPWDAYEQTGKADAFYLQFPPVTLEVGGVYVRSRGTWREITYQIFYIGEGVALGKEIATKTMGKPSGKVKMFHSEGIRAGWSYDDDRPVYRLQNKD